MEGAVTGQHSEFLPHFYMCLTLLRRAQAQSCLVGLYMMFMRVTGFILLPNKLPMNLL